MSSIIQDVKITKHVNPSKQVQDEYTMMITFHDIVYVKKITKNDMTSNLFDFDMLENLIYNCNHKQKVGDIQCDMTLTESDSFGKNLDMLLIFERNVKPMKKINEEHLFQLQEKKLDYDDKIGLAMTNLRNEINFTMIKPTTDIIQIKLTKDGDNTYRLYINNSGEKSEITLSTCSSPHDLISIGNSNRLKINIDSILKNNYVDSVHIIDTYTHIFNYHSHTHTANKIHTLIIFIDKTKKSNNRLIQYYETFDEFIQVREQFKTYHILENHPHGILVEELP